ncbi:hypothetical protein [Caulobacter segnis]|uniref:Uncharacterized protein n=1 Tax=Caulobacter segnis TaxID=88688 RepID=A0A2W5UWV2_9CAUL|nr:hypothetical protein [Caulobacter segnis]PZR31472.1 MAG: hypothetical protein DI526_19520 [Caulobacter segnis]
MRSDVLTAVSPEELARRLVDFTVPSLADLGGLDSLVAASDVLAQSLYADRAITALAGSSEPLSMQAVALVSDILGYNPHPFVVSAAAQSVLELPLDARDQRLLQRRLLERASVRDTMPAALMASECLAGAFLLADLPGASRPAAIAALDDLHPGEAEVVLRRGALLAGLAWLWSRSPDLENLLRRLSVDAEAGEQALYELALITLDRALAADDKATLLSGLELAAGQFAAAAVAGPELVEAFALSKVLTALVGFCSDEPDDLETLLAQATAATTARTLEMDRAALRTWLRPRVDAETAWWSLASALKGLSLDLAKPSWLRAVPVLEQIARLRRTMIPLATSSGDRLREAVTDAVALSFLREEGLRSHLTAWRDDDATTADDRAEATALIAAVSALADERRRSSLCRAPGIASPAQAGQPFDGMFALSRASSFTGPIERAYLAMDKALEGHIDYRGDMRGDARSLITYLHLFLSHCLDMTPAMAKGTFDFLFAKDATTPLEVELQRACWHFLRLQANGFPQHQISRELPDVGGGRADIAIVRPGFRMIIEVKRELVDASRQAIRQYLGQVATYELTGPRIGFLIVLDLVSQRGWPLTLEDNCWVEAVQTSQDSAPRMVCVWRIPGGRQAPSKVATPVQ